MTKVTTVGFEQAVIKVENEAQFAELRAAIERAFSKENVEELLKRLNSRGIRIRNFEAVLKQQAIEYVDGTLKQSGKTAKGLYQELTVSDQGQMREFYLSKLEQVEDALRHKFHKIYQYY
jgi:hypothetical protein